ncbi:MAG: efflux RND transporter periplasmic adaptor subunit [Ignavibacteriaceae bacterium]
MMDKNKNRIIILLIISAFSVLLFQGCGKEKADAKSMEQIRNEEGVPVKIEVVKYKKFTKYYSFFGKLAGIKEATKSAMVGGKIEKINAKVGDRVNKDQVIVEFAEDNPGIQFMQAKEGFENAEKTYNRMKALLKAGETAQANFDAAETQYLVAKRNYESLKDMLFIDSPFDGTVVDIKVSEGDNVKNEAHLFTVSQLNRMHTKIWASETEISSIKKGMNTEIEYNGKKYYGKVTEVSMAADPYKQAFYAEVEFDNPKMELKSGVTVDIKILTYENPKAIIIPRNLIMTDKKGTYVFLENKGAAEKRYVTNGIDSGLDYEIRNGLKPGDRVIIQGISLLDNGTKVKIVE